MDIKAEPNLTFLLENKGNFNEYGQNWLMYLNLEMSTLGMYVLGLYQLNTYD